MESYFWASDDTSACIWINETGCSLFDNCSSEGPVDPFIDMEREKIGLFDINWQRSLEYNNQINNINVSIIGLIKNNDFIRTYNLVIN